MICPVCYNKIENGKVVCNTCKFNLNDLKNASNSAVKLARKEARYDDIIYTNQIPSDLKPKKILLLAIFGGWFGLHNFYVNKTFRGWFNLLSLFLSLASYTLVHTNVLAQEFMTAVMYATILYFVTLVMWIMDVTSLLFKNYKVPVVIKKNTIKGK